MLKTQVFTPKEIVKEMLKIIDYNKNIFDKKVIDSACGEGNILMEVVERYIKFGKELNKSDEDIRKGIEENIYGVEKDSKCFEKCISNLNKVAARYNLFNISWAIFNDDSLKKKYDYKYDYIIGNPPYLKYHDISNREREYIRSRFESCRKGNFDYYYAFLEKDYNSLNINGKLIYIIPNNTFKNIFAKKLRHIIKKDTLEIVDYKNKKIFKNISTSSSLLYIGKNTNSNVINYTNKKTGEITDIDKDILGEIWYFDNKFNKNKNKNNIFGDYFHASMSVATLCNDIFIIKDYMEHDDSVQIGKDLIEKNILKIAISPRSMMRKKKELIIFPYYYNNNSLKKYKEDKLRSLFPKAFNYLSRHKLKLEQRNSNINTQWFEYGRSQGLNKMNQTKLILSTLVTNEVKVYIGGKDSIVYSGIFIVPKKEISIEVAKNILESEEFFRYVQLVGVHTSGNSIRISAKDINRFPIKL